MMKFSYKVGLLFFICQLLNSISLKAQEMMFEVPFDAQVALSDVIVEGEVLAKESFWDDAHNTIYTVHTIKVYKVFKGETTNTIELVTPGGVIGLEAQVVSHSLQLQKGNLGVFMLKSNPKAITTQKEAISNQASYTSTVGIQGFYKYALKNNSAVNTYSVIDNITGDFYSRIIGLTNREPISMDALDLNAETSKVTSTSKTAGTATITSFSATSASAGTKSILTITGNGFGETKGTIGFSDANYGGYLHTNALDNQVKSWTDSKIEVEIPDRAGTGTFKVNTVLNGNLESANDLTIDFAQINLEYNGTAYQTQHINDNGTGGNTWTMNTDFYNSDAKDAFARAFESWTCGSGINWELANTTTTINKKDLYDGVNVVTFSETMGSGMLGQCYSRYEGCYDGGEIKWYVTEMDIVFNANKNWNFSTAPPANDQIDFETVTVHELGHGHQLGHVVNTNEVMHYSISSGASLRTLSSQDLAGAMDIQTRSSTTTICGQLSMTQSACMQLGVDDAKIDKDVTMYPNPAKHTVYIRNKASINITNVSIVNIQGSLLFSSRIKDTNPVLSFDVSNLAPGVYMVKIDSAFGSGVKKLMVQ
ncbi:T9SS type A sorting domain-containing protein [Snuella sedimenti]|uniref:T9SS type A sorting domain-containing protein n=1 Tax=Snuella sedimenti TaxID=2798802 RepID=A0A8J7J6L2_9FLAO|nr:T9SS type A sorting domain-containing protein [Snuella sedimenti]MBJ6369404.1 T9SS type A sorting domain-containing protein [Snuella sedimenti]